MSEPQDGGGDAPGHSPRRGFDRFALTMGLPVPLWQIAFFVAPLGFLVWLTFWRVRNFRLTPDMIGDNWARIFGQDYFYAAYAYTFGIAAAAAVLVSLVAFPAAYALAFHVSAATRRLLVFVLITPFFTSYLVRIYSWQMMLGERGLMNFWLGEIGLGPLVLLNSATGTMVGFLTLTLPLVLLIQLFALSTIDGRLVEAAHNLGCGPLRTVLTVVVPAARVGLVLAATFAFILAFGDYVSPLFLGGSKPPTLSILITDQVKSGNHWPRAAVVAVVMVVTLFAVLTVATALAYRRPGSRT